MAILLSTTMTFAVIRMFYLHFDNHEKAWYLDELTSDRKDSNVFNMFIIAMFYNNCFHL